MKVCEVCPHRQTILGMALNLFLWTPGDGHRRAGCPVTTYTDQLCRDTRYSPNNLMDGVLD